MKISSHLANEEPTVIAVLLPGDLIQDKHLPVEVTELRLPTMYCFILQVLLYVLPSKNWDRV